MIISRRPKSRESIENAPGPSRLRAAAITARRVATALICGRFKESMGTRERATTALHIVARIPPTGIRKPSRSETPLTKAIRATAQLEDVKVPVPNRNDEVSVMRTIPAAARNSRRPTPGQPLGKVEKSLCRCVLLGPFSTLTGTQGSVNDTCAFGIPMFRDS